MVLRKVGAASGRPFIPGKGAWGVLAGMLVLVTYLTFDSADRLHQAPTAAAFDTGDTLHVPVLTSEYRHAGA
jgi:hypothetical protein